MVAPLFRAAASQQEGCEVCMFCPLTVQNYSNHASKLLLGVGFNGLETCKGRIPCLCRNVQTPVRPLR